MTSENRIERLRVAAVRRIEAFDFEEAVRLLDRALAICRDEEQAELLTLNKASALIELGEDGPEVRALPEILMRRRNPRHTVLAAHTLQRKKFISNEFEEAIRFCGIALRDVDTVDNPVWKASILTDLGNANVSLSQFEEAIRSFRRALACISPSDELRRALVLANMGHAYAQIGQIERGIRLMNKGLGVFDRPALEDCRCETLLDICGAWLELGELELARQAGRDCLSIASEPRQVRNCHFLLGEVALRRGRRDEAKRHFEVLAAFYPGFAALPALLLSFDILKVVNLKL